MANLNHYAITDPNCDLSENTTAWYSMIGASDLSLHLYSTNNISSNGFTINVPISNSTNVVFIRSSGIIELPVTIDLYCAGGPGNCYQPTYEAFRSNPLQKITQSVTFEVAGGHVSYESHQIIPVKERFDVCGSRKIQMAPTYTDPCQNYNDFHGTNRSPFAPYSDNPYEVSRSSYPITVALNTATHATITASLFTNLFDWLPFTPADDAKGINLSPFKMTFTFITQLARIWSRDNVLHPNGALTNFTIAFGIPTLRILEATLPRQLQIPSTVNYPYHAIDFYPTTISAVPSITTTVAPYTQTTQLMELNCVPSKIYIFAKVSSNYIYSSVNNAVSTPDCFCEITACQFTFGVRTNLLANLSQPDMYNLSIRNGLSKKWNYVDWIGHGGVGAPYLMGSILCLDPVRDLSTSLTTGMSGKMNFQAQISFRNLQSGVRDIDLCVLVVNDGLMTISDTRMYLENYVISNVDSLQQSPKTYREFKMAMGGGGEGEGDGGSAKEFFQGLISKIRSVGQPVNQFLRDTKLLSTVLPLIPGMAPLGTLAKTLGYGEGEGEGEGDGGYLANGDGGVLAGGRVLRRRRRM